MGAESIPDAEFTPEAAAVPIPIVWRSGPWVAVNKPPGLAVHAAPGSDGSVLRQLRDTGLEGDWLPLHRLDKGASGVLLLARNVKTAAYVQRRWGEVEKTYWAFCAGAPEADEGLIDAPILEHQSSRPERMQNALRAHGLDGESGESSAWRAPPPKQSAVHPAGRAARTAWRVLERHGRASWVEFTPRQGRMHQIRIHARHWGHALLGDDVYGADHADLAASLGLERPALHAAKLRVPLPPKPGRPEWVALEAPLPSDLRRALDILRAGSGADRIQA